MNDLLTACIGIRADKRLGASAEELAFIFEACRSKSIKIFTSPTNQQPVGYVIYAKVSRYTLRAWMTSGLKPKITGEWKDGYLPVILDVVFSDGFFKFCRQEMHNFLRKMPIFVYSHRNKVKFCKSLDNRHCILKSQLILNGGRCNE